MAREKPSQPGATIFESAVVLKHVNRHNGQSVAVVLAKLSKMAEFGIAGRAPTREERDDRDLAGEVCGGECFTRDDVAGPTALLSDPTTTSD